MFVMLITIVATLVALIQVAIALGVVLHILIHIFRSAEAVRLERVAPMEDGYFSEGDSLKICPQANRDPAAHRQSVLYRSGELEEKFPNMGQVQGSEVIVCLRDRENLGSTLIRTIQHYAHELKLQGNKLMLAGISQHMSMNSWNVQTCWS